jgi:hypothetical protein
MSMTISDRERAVTAALAAAGDYPAAYHSVASTRLRSI